MSAVPAPAAVWPDYFPAECPPADAAPAVGTLYRFTKKQTPDAKDVTCHWNRFEQHREEWARDGRQCQACGLSVYLTVETARQKRAMIPALRKAHVHRVTLVTADGKLKNTPSVGDPEHHTWWAQSTIHDVLGFLQYVEGPNAA